MSRKFALAFLTLSLFVAASTTCLPVFAQDLGDIDMFGDAPKDDQPQERQDDPLDFGDLAPADPQMGEGSLEPTAQEEFMQALEAEMQKGRKLAEAGNCGEAIGVFNGILAQRETQRYAPALLEKGKCLAKLNEIGLANMNLKEALRGASAYPDLMVEVSIAQGDVFMDSRPPNYQDAVESYDLAVQTDPMNLQALLKRSQAQIRLASTGYDANAALNLEQAVKSLDRVIDADDSLADAYMERARANLLKQELDKAIDDADKAYLLNDESSEFAARRGVIYLSRAEDEKRRYDSDMDQVVADYQIAINSFAEYLRAEGSKSKDDFDKDDPDAFLPDQVWVFSAAARIGLASHVDANLGSSYYTDAIEEANKAIEFESDSPDAFYQRGIAQRLLGDLQGAIDSWTTSLEIAPRNPELHLRRGIAHYYNGDLRLARQDFKVAEAMPDGRALFWSGVTHAKENDFKLAIRNYSAALQLQPDYVPAYSNRGLAYMQLGDYDRAEKDFNEIVLRDSQDQVARQRRDQARQMREQPRFRTSQYYP